ncbi:MAG: peptidoglycan DD-metalloendopeptidase family protein [Chloroflexi bacterium]|nr:peptidoglycan DD-metalloendopeptidase family protein [Chloroflexota bacterium]
MSFAWWWYSNDTPPTVSVEGPTGVVRGGLTARAVVQPGDRANVVAAELDSQPLPAERVLTIDTQSVPDGEHTLVVRAEDQSRRGNTSSASYTFRSDNTPPRVELTIRPPQVPQGHSYLIRVHTDEPSRVQAELSGAPLWLYQTGGDGWTVGGFGPDQREGQRPLRVTVEDAVGNTATVERSVRVAPFAFTEDHLEVPADLAALLSPSVRYDEDVLLREVYTKVSGPPLWQGPFRRPVGGEITTQFGEVRYYNGGPATGHHGGTDFAVSQRTPVLAPARGRVVLKQQVKLRGNALVLDHGAGVFTTYGHLAEWLVQPGADVQAGQEIGLVGSTGLSTGPHLHWEIWVGGENVDAMEWTQTSFP